MKKTFIVLIVIAFVIGILTPNIIYMYIQQTIPISTTPLISTPIRISPTTEVTTTPTVFTTVTPTATAAPVLVTPAPTPVPTPPITLITTITPNIVISTITTTLQRIETVTTSYRFAFSDWFIEIDITGEGKGTLTIGYMGSEPLVVENPLLPLIAGIDIELLYRDPSRNTTFRKLGTYYKTTMTISPGISDSISFDARGLTMIRARGRILGKIPIYIEIPIAFPQTTMVVTVTQIPQTITTTTITTTYSCRYVKEAEYSEPPSKDVTVAETSNETIASDGVVEIYIPMKINEPVIPIIMKNIGDVPLVVKANYIEYTIINVTEDGIHYRIVNKSRVEFMPIPTVDFAPELQSCMYSRPVDTEIIHSFTFVFEPFESSKIAALLSNIEELRDFNKGWIYIKMRVSYTPIKEIYRIEADRAFARVARLYSQREIEFVFRVYVDS